MQAFRLPLAARVRTHGFTIVELVVMIAIIAFVTLLIVPGILHGREAARKTQYKNNLQSLCLALDMQWSSNIKNGSLADFAATNPGAASDLHTDGKLLLTLTLAIVATFAAMFDALFIRFAVRFFNRRSDRFRQGNYEESESSSWWSGWFCPRSSSPI